jgi:HJR/Mrr/RecB family endonuclease
MGVLDEARDEAWRILRQHANDIGRDVMNWAHWNGVIEYDPSTSEELRTEFFTGNYMDDRELTDWAYDRELERNIDEQNRFLRTEPLFVENIESGAYRRWFGDETLNGILSALRQLRAALTDRDAESTTQLFREILRMCERADVTLDYAATDEIDTTLNILSIEETHVIFAPPAPKIHVPELIRVVQRDLISYIAADPRALFLISSREFEQLIAEVFSRQGFMVELTQATRDGGRDIIAIQEILGLRSKYLVECKRYAPHRNVSVAVVQRLYGVKMAEAANKAVLVTSSGFTRDAKRFASEHLWDLDLKTYDDVMQWVKHYAG